MKKYAKFLFKKFGFIRDDKKKANDDAHDQKSQSVITKKEQDVTTKKETVKNFVLDSDSAARDFDFINSPKVMVDFSDENRFSDVINELFSTNRQDATLNAKDSPSMSKKDRQVISMINFLINVRINHISDQLENIHNAITKLSFLYSDIVNKKMKQGVDVFRSFEIEALRQIHDAIVKPLANGQFGDIKTLLHVEGMLNFFVVLYQNGLGNKNTISKLAAKLNIDKSKIEDIFNKIREITSDNYAWGHRYLTTEQIDKIFTYFGIKDANKELGERIRLIEKNLLKIKEGMPDIYENVASNVKTIFQQCGCPINLPDNLKDFEKERFTKYKQTPVSESFVDNVYDNLIDYAQQNSLEKTSQLLQESKERLSNKSGELGRFQSANVFQSSSSRSSSRFRRGNKNFRGQKMRVSKGCDRQDKDRGETNFSDRQGIKKEDVKRSVHIKRRKCKNNAQ